MKKRTTSRTLFIFFAAILLVIFRQVPFLLTDPKDPTLELRIGSGMGPDLMSEQNSRAVEVTREGNLQLFENMLNEINRSSKSLRIVSSLNAHGESSTQTYEKVGDGDWILQNKLETTTDSDEDNRFPKQ